VLLASAAWIWVSRAPNGSAAGTGVSLPHQGFRAPDITLQAGDGASISLADLAGRPVLINLWTSWCPPCKAEMPALQRVYEDYQEQGLEILAVNATNQDRLADAAAFAGQLGLTFPILFDEDGEVSLLYQLRSLPTTYFIDRQGIIQDVVIGGPMSEALLRIRIDQLLEE